jgi:hypothetical protein
VTALAVIKAFDVFVVLRLSRRPGRVATMMHQLVFQAAPEALHRRVVIAVAPARHERLHAELLHQFSIVMCAVLAATVGMVNQFCCRSLVAHRLPQRRCRQRLRHARVHRVPHLLAGKTSLMPAR